MYCDYDDRGTAGGDGGGGGYSEDQRSLEDPRLLDAAETLVTLQTSDLVSSNNPLFGSSITSSHSTDPYRLMVDLEDKRQFQVLGDLQPSMLQFEQSQTIQEDGVGSVVPGSVIQQNPGTSVIVHNDQVGPTPPNNPTVVGSSGRGGGRGRGRGPSKRGRKKAEAGGRGGGAAGGGAEAEDDTAEPEVQEKKAEMLRVGPLFINSTLIDTILSERKQELMEHPSVIEFLSRHKP